DGFLGVNDPAPRDKACLPVSCVTRSHVVEKPEEFSVFRRKGNGSQPVFLGFRDRNLKLARECLTGRYYYRPLNLLNVLESKTRCSKEDPKAAVRSMRQMGKNRSHISARQAILGGFAHLSGKTFVDDDVQSLDVFALIQCPSPNHNFVAFDGRRDDI